eukprot:3360188-Rhodomonas_salina.3
MCGTDTAYVPARQCAGPLRARATPCVFQVQCLNVLVDGEQCWLPAPGGRRGASLPWTTTNKVAPQPLATLIHYI